MGLTSWTTVGVCAALVLTAPLAALALWGRVRGNRAVRAGQRLALVLVCQLSAILLTAAWLNKDFTFYSSWDELLGTQARPDATATEAPQQVAARVDARFAQGKSRTEGVRIDTVALGPASRVRAKLIVFLPPQYGDPAYAATKFPVVQLLPGYPGQPQTWLGKLKVAQTLLAEVRAGRSKPFVLVLPAINVAGLRDTECADVTGGPQVEKWLTDDVRGIVTRGYRVRADAGGWGLMGYSTGGFCATKLAMRRPDLFRAGVSMSGYFTIAHDAKTGDLFGGDVAAERQNSPSWLIRHRPPPPVSLLLTGTAQDGATVAQMRAFAAAARPPLKVQELVVPRGGHNTGVWAAQVPACLAWLSRELAAPTR